MPQLAIAVIVGAGLMAGWKWVSRELSRQSEVRQSDADRATAETARTTVAPAKDLGALEWDETAQVYRPRPADTRT